MLSWLGNAWRVPELRRRVLFTAFVLFVYRLGSWLPAPGVNASAIENFFSGSGGSILGLLNLFSGGRPVAVLALRPRDHAVRDGIDHRPAPDRGDPPPR